MTPRSPSAPSRRLTSGLTELAACSSRFAEVTPYSSAAIRAFSVQRTMSAHWLSPWRTTGPSGSFEMISGRMMWFSGSVKAARVEARPEASVV